jgi:hypothetical protein
LLLGYKPVQHVTVLNTVSNCITVVLLYYGITVVVRNAVMRRITVFVTKHARVSCLRQPYRKYIRERRHVLSVPGPVNVAETVGQTGRRFAVRFRKFTGPV